MKALKSKPEVFPKSNSASRLQDSGHNRFQPIDFSLKTETSTLNFQIAYLVDQFSACQPPCNSLNTYSFSPLSLMHIHILVLAVKNLPTKAGDVRDAVSIPTLGRSPGGGHSSPLQYSCLENPVDRGADRLQSIGSKRVDETEGS